MLPQFSFQSNLFQIFKDMKDISTQLATILASLILQVTGFQVPLIAIQALMLIVTGYTVYEFSNKLGKWGLFLILFVFLASVSGIIPAG